MYDLVIIGASAAALPSAIYAARRHLNFVIITKDIGGEMALSGEVNNWPGIEAISGIELTKKFHEHVKSYGVKIEEGVEVISIKSEKNYHFINAKDHNGKKKSYKTKTILVTSGIHPRKMEVKGEVEFKGKGVTYCTVCDGPLFKGKITATIGAGNAALESALMMSKIAKKVYLLTRYPDTKETLGGFPKGETILVKKLKETKNIEVIYNTNTKEIVGSNFVEGVIYEDKTTKEKKEIKVNGIMAHIGTTPNSDFIDCANKNKRKEIEVNLRCETNCPGIFAAGDVTNVPFKQIIIAAGQGVTAVLSAINYINRWTE